MRMRHRTLGRCWCQPYFVTLPACWSTPAVPGAVSVFALHTLTRKTTLHNHIAEVWNSAHPHPSAHTFQSHPLSSLLPQHDRDARKAIEGESREMLGIMDQLRYNGLDHSPATQTRRSSRMRVKLQLVMCSDEDHEETVTDVMTLNKNSQRIEHLGLTLAEAKQRLSILQQHLLQQQIDMFLDTCSPCSDCGALLKVKAHASRSFRTLFGTCKLDSPRLEHCDCTRRQTSSFRPLSALLTESVAPERRSRRVLWGCNRSRNTTCK